MRSIFTAFSAAALLAVSSAALAQGAAQSEGQSDGQVAPSSAAADAVAQSSQSAQTAVQTREFAPDPQAMAAAAASSQSPVRVRLPNGEFQEISPTYTGTEQPRTGGAMIVVPSNARAGTGYYDAGDYDTGDNAVVYDDSYIYTPDYVLSPEYSTVYEYDTLIRAGVSPSFSITTLHGGRSPYYSGYYHRPYSYYYNKPTSPYLYRYPSTHHHSRYALDRFDKHNRPYSSGYSRYSGVHRYDPLGHSLHRGAQLRFHEASRPKFGSQGRSHSHREFSHRDVSPRAHTGTRHHDSSHDARGRSGHEGSRVRDVSPIRDSSGRDRSPRSGGSRDGGGGHVRRSPK